MEWIEKLNVLQSKIGSLIDVVTRLKAENDLLKSDNEKLTSEVIELKAELDKINDDSAKYIEQRDLIKERVEHLINMIDSGAL